MLLAACSALSACSQSRPENEPPVVLRDPRPFLGSAFKTGIRRVPPRDNGDPGMRKLMLKAVGDYDGPIAFLGEREDGDQRFGRLEKRIRSISPEHFTGRDSADAREALEEMGASYLLVSQLDPAIAPWPPNTANTIHELLRDGIPPPHFQPVVIGRVHILYRIAPPLELSSKQQKAITAYVRARLTGGEAAKLPALPDDRARAPDGKVRVIIALRSSNRRCRSGRALGRRMGEGRTIQAALDEAMDHHRRRWRRTRDRTNCESSLPTNLNQAAKRLTLQIEVVHRMAAISDRTEDRLYYLIELGREGVYLQRDSGVVFISPHQTIHRAIANERHLVERLGEWHNLSKRVWTDEDRTFGRFEAIGWLEPRPGAAPQTFYRGVPLVRMQDITRESVIDALVEGARFLANNQTDRGEYRYVYRPLRTRENDRWVEENNIVRHSLCPMVVAKAHNLRRDPELAASAKRGIDYTLSFLRRREDRCYIWHQDHDTHQPNAKMGTVAAMVLSILEYGRNEDIEEYRDELQCFANQILAMQEPSGQFTHYDVPRSHPFHGRHNTIYPGELMFALSRLYEWSGDVRFREAFARAVEFQQRWFRETRAETTEDNIYDDRTRQDLISFEPWGIMSLEDMYRQTGEERYLSFGFELVEFMDGRFHYDLGRAQYADYLGGYFKTQLELPAINSTGYTEGATAAFALAVRSGQNIEERRLSALLGVRFALQLQYYPDRSLFHVPDPAAARGGVRYNLSYSRVRNDYMYHALNALAQAAMYLRPEDYPAQIVFPEVPEILAPAFATD